MVHYLKLHDYITLYRKAVARLNSENDYRLFQLFQGQLLVRFLSSRHIELTGQRVVDIGCGYGGYSLALRQAGAKVVSLDRFNQNMGHSMQSVLGDALALPLNASRFDVVVCTSLIEHLPEPERLLSELYRIVKPNGWVYLSFPPFYSPYGGHQFSPFHYFGMSTAIQLSNRFGRLRKYDWVKENYPVTPDTFEEAYGGWGLYPLTITKFETLLQQTEFICKERSTRLSPVDLSRLPFLRELLTWHVQYLLVRP